MASPLAKQRTQTQWAAQFVVAAELVRRGYTVAFTMGNRTPDADLMVESPRHDQFLIDIKGQSGKSGWLIRSKSSRANLYYVLVALAPLVQGSENRQPDVFYVMTQAQAGHLIRRYQAAHPKNKNKATGFGWTDPHDYKDKWANLPP
jgi:hypothetical protein